MNEFTGHAILFLLIFHIVLAGSNIGGNNLVFGLQNDQQVYSSIDFTKLIPIVENNTMFKEKTNGHGYLFANGVYKLKPHETVSNSTFQGPIDMVYFLSTDNNGGYYDKTLVVTVNSELNITGYMEYPSYLVPTGYPLPAGTPLHYQENYVPPKTDYNKLGIIMPPSPYEQARHGVATNDIECFHGILTLELIFKAEDKSPACVKDNTVSDLLKRGWALNQTNHESVSVIIEQSKTANLYKNGTAVATLIMDIEIKNFQQMSPPILVNIFYPNGTLYGTNKISSNVISSNGHYKYIVTITSNNPQDVFGKHKIDVIRNGNINQIIVDIAKPS